MQKLYDTLELIIKNGDQSALQNLFTLLQQQKYEQLGEIFGLPLTVEYALKRLINACMSTDPVIRNNSSKALSKLHESSVHFFNAQKLLNYILEMSNYKKGVGNRKKNETQSLAAGRILVFKTFASLFDNNLEAYKAAKQVITDFTNLEEQTLEVLYLISNNKLLKMKFMDLSPTKKLSKQLYKMLLHQKQTSEQNINLNQARELISECTLNYPEDSLSLNYLGKFLSGITDTPAQFFKEYSTKFLLSSQQLEQESANVHQIYYVLIVLKYFLESTKISAQNYKAFLDIKIVAVWLQQLRVLNKKMKNLAKSIIIKFEQENGELFAYKLLVKIHEADIYLDNISANHPLKQLYDIADKQKYWEYLYNLCLNQFEQQKKRHLKQKVEDNTQNKPEEIEQENSQNQSNQQEAKFTNYNELAFILQKYQLKDQHFVFSLTLLLNIYHFTVESQKKGQNSHSEKQMLYLVINVLNEFFKQVGSKSNKNKVKKHPKNKICYKVFSILFKINWELLQSFHSEENIASVKACVSWIKKKVTKIKKQKLEETLSPLQINFYHFYAAMLYFVMLYPEELENCSELQMVFVDIEKLMNEEETKPKKRVKKSPKIEEEEDVKKPVHVLVDIFISLMTKPPQFLRKSIHALYVNIIPMLQQADLESMLTVITTPDAQFIEEM